MLVDNNVQQVDFKEQLHFPVCYASLFKDIVLKGLMILVPLISVLNVTDWTSLMQ